MSAKTAPGIRPSCCIGRFIGSFERFLGILIENYAGRFPLWLAPVQVVVASIVTDAAPYAEEVAARLRAAGLNVRTDVRNEKINAKVREHSLAHVPVLAVVGRREAEQGQVALRRLGSQAQDVVSLGRSRFTSCRGGPASRHQAQPACRQADRDFLD